MCWGMSEKMWKLSPTARFERAISGFLAVVTTDTCKRQDNNHFADLNSSCHGQNQEKEETLSTELNNFLLKNFPDKR